MLRIFCNVFCNNGHSPCHTGCGAVGTSGRHRRVAPGGFASQCWTLAWLLLVLNTCGAQQQQQQTSQDPPGLHNFWQATPGVFLGSEPEGEEAFASLQKLGITTLVSVDGATPDLVLAKKFGLRYLHIPFGYDGIPEHAAKSLSRVARDIHSPVYVHCHHGKHRGPAAAAIICLAAGSVSRDNALLFMTSAGTSKDYDGLWRDVRNFEPPHADTTLPEFVEVAKVESIAAAMAKLDRSFDHLKLSARVGWKPLTEHPDLIPAAEALLVQEGLRESARQLDKEYSEEFRVWLKESEQLAATLYDAVKAGEEVAASRLVKSLEQTCIRCHRKHRNP